MFLEKENCRFFIKIRQAFEKMRIDAPSPAAAENEKQARSWRRQPAWPAKTPVRRVARAQITGDFLSVNRDFFAHNRELFATEQGTAFIRTLVPGFEAQALSATAALASPPLSVPPNCNVLVL